MATPGFLCGIPAAQDGPYPVGARRLVLVDSSRAGRTLVTEVWYPAVRGTGRRPHRFSEFFGRHAGVAAEVVARFGGKMAEVDRRFRSVARRDARVRRGRFPLLVFSHGNGGIRHQNVLQVEYLASHGYIVASPDHTGNAALAPLPDVAVVYDGKARARSAKDRPRDVSFVIDELIRRSAARRGWLSGRIDPERIGVLGHSFGGFTACKVAETDPRVKAILAMTVALGRSVQIPVMVMLAGRDHTVTAAGNRLAGTYWRVCDGPKYLLTFVRAGHFTFSDMDLINPRFGDGVGKDRKTGEPYLDTKRAKELINAYSLAFFDAWLKGDAGARARLRENLDPEEIRLRVDNVPEAKPARDG